MHQVKMSMQEEIYIRNKMARMEDIFPKLHVYVYAL